MIDKNWPQLSAARIDDMVDTATAFPQEKQQVFVWFSRPALALVAALVLVIAVAVSWQAPRYGAPQEESMTASGDDLSDYAMYELLEDLT